MIVVDTSARSLEPTAFLMHSRSSEVSSNLRKHCPPVAPTKNKFQGQLDGFEPEISRRN